METMGINCHKYCGSLVSVYSLHVRSKETISDDHMMETLLGIFRKFQHLRCRLDEINGRYYFREMQSAKIDYKRTDEYNWKSAHEQLLCKTYDLYQGPLWCCRLLPMLPGYLEDTDSCFTDTLSYVVMFAFMHSITDGTSNVKMLGHFMRILNTVMEGKIHEEQELLLFPNMDKLLPPEEIKIHITDIWCIIREVWSFIFHRRTPFYEAYPPPAGEKGATKMVYKILSEETTAGLLRRCKEEKVTVHSAFTLAASCAMVDMIAEETGNRGDIYLKIGHAVNVRRFIQRDMSNAFGAYFVLLIHGLTVEKNSWEAFWSHARDYNERLHRELNNGSTLQSKRVLELCFSNPEIVIESQRGQGQNCKYEFGTSNLGQIDHMLKSTESPVESVAVCRSTAFHFMGSGFTHNLQTYRGRLNYTLDYFTNVVSQVVAEEYSRRVVELLCKIGNGKRQTSDCKNTEPTT